MFQGYIASGHGALLMLWRMTILLQTKFRYGLSVASRDSHGWYCPHRSLSVLCHYLWHVQDGDSQRTWGSVIGAPFVSKDARCFENLGQAN